MKRLISVPLLLFIAFAACKKASGPANGNSVQPNNNLDSTVSISATINGAKWQTDSTYGYIVKTSGNDSTAEGLMITATKLLNGSATSMTFNISKYTGPNTYTIQPPANEVIYYVGTHRHLATSGQFIVTSDSGAALEGTFNFVADTITVTNGVFNVAKP